MTKVRPNVLFTIANKNDLNSFVKFSGLHFILKKIRIEIKVKFNKFN